MKKRRKPTYQGLLIKNRLAQICMTQNELAERLKISPSYLGDILKGRRPGSKHMDKIFSILGIEEDEYKKAVGG